MASSSTPSGTLFHAVFANKTWGLERREVTNIVKSKSLVLMWRVGAVRSHFSVDFMERILQKVPCRAADQNADNDNDDDDDEGTAGLHFRGNPDMGGFSCIPWTENALRALRDVGIVDVAKDIGQLPIGPTFCGALLLMAFLQVR